MFLTVGDELIRLDLDEVVPLEWSGEMKLWFVHAAPACLVHENVPGLAAPDDVPVFGALFHGFAQPADLGDELLRGQEGPDVKPRLRGHQYLPLSLLLVIRFALDHRLLIHFFLAINNCWILDENILISDVQLCDYNY